MRYLEDLFHCSGVPEYLVSDNEDQFKSNIFNGLLNKYNIRHTYTAFDSLQANASERVNRIVLSDFQAYIDPSQMNWDENLIKLNCALRSGFHRAINITLT